MKQKSFSLSSRLLPLVLMLLGSVLRLAYLGSIPGGLHQDESFVAWNAFALLHEGLDFAGHVWPVYLADWGDGHSALYVWLLMPLFALNHGHIHPFLSRLPQAVVSIFTLWAVYCLLKRMFDQEKASWGLFLLAVCPWHITMSRWGLDANLAPGFLIFGLYFFVRGMENEKWLPVSGLFYGLSLYCYAVIWPIVPLLLVLQIGYALAFRKIHINRYSILASAILGILALPLLLFLCVNSGILPEIALPFMTIPKMGGYRGSEVAFSFPQMYQNLRTALSLLYHQNTGAPYDILLPWGLFYDIGRIFIIIGAGSLVIRVVRSLVHRVFTWETFLLIQLIGGGFNCLIVTAVLHQIDSLYIPLVLCETWGVLTFMKLLGKINPFLSSACSVLLTVCYLICLVLFQRDYYTEYRTLTDAYFAKGVGYCVDFALQQCKETGISTISVEKGAQWPRLLVYTETLPSQYLSTVTYDIAPAPAAFTTADGIRINTRINYTSINSDSIYIIYYTDEAIFSQDFNLTPFYDWYVAVPK